jgi:hypothetical protein
VVSKQCVTDTDADETLLAVTVGIATATLQFDDGFSIGIQNGFEYRDERYRMRCDEVFQSGKSVQICAGSTGYEAPCQ